MAQLERVVIGGVDTHKDVHVAAVIDERGKILDTANFKATAEGYRLNRPGFRRDIRALIYAAELASSWSR